MENKKHWLDLDRGDGTTTRQMLGLSASLGVIFTDGTGQSFDGLNTDSINYDEKKQILSFEVANRVFFVPNVRYWTLDR